MLNLKAITYIFISVIFFVSFSKAYEDHLKYEKGYYYVLIKKGSFKRINAKLIEIANKHGWDVVHTLNVDKTLNLKTPYKTHLLCKKSKLEHGYSYFKAIGILAPCRIAIYRDGKYIKIATEDLMETATKFQPEDKEFFNCIRRVQNELLDILNSTANEFERKALIPQY
jgi:uncharacterized protein (DUF302 family)